MKAERDMWQHPWPADSHYLSFIEPNSSWPVIHQVFFFLFSDQGHYTLLYRYAKYNRVGGRKNKQSNTGLGQLQVQGGGNLGKIFVQLSVHLQTIAGMYFARNFYKATNNADISRWLTRPLLVNNS